MSKNNKPVQTFKTFPFSKIFSARVYVDINNSVLFDTVLGIVIAYIRISQTHMMITFVIPKILDDDSEEISVPIRDYFNPDHVDVRNISDYYFNDSGKHIYIGHPCKDTNYQIRLPRLYDPDDATNVSGTDGAIEVIDEDSDFFEPFDPDEFAADIENMIDRID